MLLAFLQRELAIYNNLDAENEEERKKKKMRIMEGRGEWRKKKKIRIK